MPRVCSSHSLYPNDVLENNSRGAEAVTPFFQPLCNETLTRVCHDRISWWDEKRLLTTKEKSRVVAATLNEMGRGWRLKVQIRKLSGRRDGPGI